jgi:ribosomal protein S18 acetylase RimI-like enzyme
MTSRPRSTPDFRLRSATAGDFPFALALYLDGSRDLLTKIGRFDEARIVKRFRGGYRAEQSRIVTVDGRDVGWVQVAESKRRLHLRQIHLVGDFQGQGIGTALIEDLCERARTLGKPVTLDVLHGNPAKALYERLGFEVTGADVDKEQMIRRP